MVLGSKHIWVVCPIVVPQTRQLLQSIWQTLGSESSNSESSETSSWTQNHAEYWRMEAGVSGKGTTGRAQQTLQ